jgi:hypothetical protein
MIRVLVMIAVTGFLVSVVTLSTAVAIGGPDLLTDSVWNRWVHLDGDWNWDDHEWAGGRHSRRLGPDGTRELPWTGGDTLDVDVPAEITYTQAPGPGKLTVTGPQRELDALSLEGGRLYWSRHGRHWGDLTVVMTAPAVTRFDLSSSGKLSIEGYKQDKLSIEIAGDGDVTARGEAKSVALSVSGSGNTDLSELKTGDASVDIDGSGEATLAPTGAANISISGSGDVTLLTRPARLESNVSGSGSLHQKDGAAPAAPAPPEPPAPPKPPSRHGKRT